MATTGYVGVGHPSAEAFECLACLTARTGETLADVVARLVANITSDPALPDTVRAQAAEILAPDGHTLFYQEEDDGEFSDTDMFVCSRPAPRPAGPAVECSIHRVDCTWVGEFGVWQCRACQVILLRALDAYDGRS